MKERLQNKQILILLILLLICLGLRLTGMFYFWHEGSVAIQSPDAYYHMRRILLALFAPPLGSIDFFRGMAPNNPCIWTIYYDMFYAGIISVFTLGKATVSQAEFIASVIPPFIGTASAYLLFLICRPFGIWTALLSVAVFIILPRNISVSIFADMDHHSFEVLCFLGSIYSVTKILQDGLRRDIAFFALWMVSLFLVWDGSTLYAGLIALSTFIWGIKQKKGFFEMFQGFLTAGLILLPLYLYSPDTNSFNIRYDFVSLFQPLFLIAVAFFFYSLAQFEKDKKIKILPVTFCLLLSGLLASSIINGFSFIFAKNGGYAFTPFIAELKPLLTINLYIIIQLLTPFFFFTPIPAAWMFIEGWRDKTKISHFMIGINFFFALVLTLDAQRFIYLLGIFIAPVIILGITQILQLIRLPLLKKTLPVLSAGLIIIPVAPLSFSIIRQNFILPDSLYTFYDWIKRKTPESGDFFRPGEMPAYSILSHWDQGHYLTYLAHRPSVSDNFGFNATVAPLFFLSQSETEAEGILKPVSARYIMVSSRYLYQGSSLEIVGVTGDKWQFNDKVFYQNQEYLLGYPTAKFINSTFMRLYFQDGGEIEWAQQKGLQHFRLVYETAEQIPVHLFPNNQGTQPFFLLYGENYPAGFKPLLSKPSRYKLYEYVPGAVIKGITDPGGKVKAYTFVKTNTGRKFIYLQTTRSGKDGRFELVIPYGKSLKSTGDTQAISDYTVSAGNKSFPVTVTEPDVLGHRTINITSTGRQASTTG